MYSNARISDSAQIYGYAQVHGNAEVSENARIFGQAQVGADSWVFGDARVFGQAWVLGNARVLGDARVSGTAWLFGHARVLADARIEREWHILLVGPLGPVEGTERVTLFRTKNNKHLLYTNGWTGTLATFVAEMQSGLEENWTEDEITQFMTQYAAVQVLGEVTVARWASNP